MYCGCFDHFVEIVLYRKSCFTESLVLECWSPDSHESLVLQEFLALRKSCSPGGHALLEATLSRKSCFAVSLCIQGVFALPVLMPLRSFRML
jgi:hypothetical protein